MISGVFLSVIHRTNAIFATKDSPTSQEVDSFSLLIAGFKRLLCLIPSRLFTLTRTGIIKALCITVAADRDTSASIFTRTATHCKCVIVVVIDVDRTES